MKIQDEELGKNTGNLESSSPEFHGWASVNNKDKESVLNLDMRFVERQREAEKRITLIKEDEKIAKRLSDMEAQKPSTSFQSESIRNVPKQQLTTSVIDVLSSDSNPISDIEDTQDVLHEFKKRDKEIPTNILAELDFEGNLIDENFRDRQKQEEERIRQIQADEKMAKNLAKIWQQEANKGSFDTDVVTRNRSPFKSETLKKRTHTPKRQLSIEKYMEATNKKTKGFQD